MITLHLLQVLSDAGFGTIDTDLFWAKLPLGKTGIAIFARGGEVSIGRKRAVQPFDLMSRGENHLLAADKLEKIAEYLSREWVQCDLPLVPDRSNKVYKNARISDLSNIDDSLGEDENGQMIFRLTGSVIYNKV